MSSHLQLLNAAADNVRRLSVRSIVIVVCLVAILSPFLIATAIFDSVRRQSILSIDNGADLFVSANRAGRNAPLSTEWVDRIGAVPGVLSVTPRIVGRDYIIGPVVVTGMPFERLPREVKCVEGRLPRTRGETLVGRELARELNLAPGKSFTLNVNPGLRFKVTGLFTAASPLWSTRLVYIDFADAQELFALEGMATELLVTTRSGYADAVYDKLRELGRGDRSAVPLRVVSKRIAKEMLRRGFSRRAGVFTALYIVAFALAIPCLAVTSGLGFSERRREIGLYRATGWHTVEVLEMVVLENLLLALMGASAALLLSFLWMKLTNGFLVAQFFLPEAGAVPGFKVPSSFFPLPAFVAFAVALMLTLVGSLYTSYRTAVIPPMDAIR